MMKYRYRGGGAKNRGGGQGGQRGDEEERIEGEQKKGKASQMERDRMGRTEKGKRREKERRTRRIRVSDYTYENVPDLARNLCDRDSSINNERRYILRRDFAESHPFFCNF